MGGGGEWRGGGYIEREEREQERERNINNANVPNNWTINKSLISTNCFHIVAFFLQHVHRSVCVCVCVMMEMLKFIVKLWH